MTDQPLSPASPPVSPLFANNPSNRIIGLSILLLILLFTAMGQVDHPTLTIVHGFTNPLVDQIGDIGNKLGNGLTLVLISLGIGVIGLWFNSDRWKWACYHTLFAHGISAIITQTLKHGLSRPRPRIMDTTPWDIRPSLESGLDSFPSGHTSASFSMAMVLAYYFPRARVLWFTLATFVSTCRIIKGSHFPTDVLGGVLIGIGSGLVLVYARNQWKDMTARAFVHGLPWLTTAFGLLWILVPHPGIELESNMSLVFGLIMIMTGLGLRLWWIRECSFPNHPSPATKVPTWPRLLMGFGLATSTGSLIVVGASLLAGTIWWLGTPFDLTEIQNRFLAGLNPIWIEVIIGLGMFFLTILIFSIRFG
ncbi:MAG: phosphatase PAP2 family protein [Nitrospirales bacterium]|nr:phosphatase PAP2 family protein [Nitrospirales bacterium]